MKWNCAQNNFPLLPLYLALPSAEFCEATQMLPADSQEVRQGSRLSESPRARRHQQGVARHTDLPQGSLKRKVFLNPLTEQHGSACFICLVSHRTSTRDYYGQSTVSKTSNSSSTDSPGLGRSWNALLLGQSVSKPDLVAVSCLFIKLG